MGCKNTADDKNQLWLVMIPLEGYPLALPSPDLPARDLSSLACEGSAQEPRTEGEESENCSGVSRHLGTWQFSLNNGYYLGTKPVGEIQVNRPASTCICGKPSLCQTRC